MSKKQIHAVVFDMDGVLIDSEPLQYQACRQMVAQVNLELSEKVFQDRWVGHKTSDSLREMLVEHGVEADVAELMEFKNMAYHRSISTEPIEPRPGIRDLLGWLQGRAIPRAVASSSSHTDIRLVLERLELTGFFQHLTSSEDCQRPKPDPEIYQLSAHKLGFAPPVCLAIEDTHIGATAAIAAGLPCVAFPHRFTFDQDFSAADLVLEDISTLPERFIWRHGG